MTSQRDPLTGQEQAPHQGGARPAQAATGSSPASGSGDSSRAAGAGADASASAAGQPPADAGRRSRRGLLLGGVAAGAGAAVGLSVGATLPRWRDHGGSGDAGHAGVGPSDSSGAENQGARPDGGHAGTSAANLADGTATIPFHGAHQAGIATAPAARVLMVALDLTPEMDREAIIRLLRLLTDDAARLATGRAPVADPEPELAERPARLTVTFGFGPGFVERAGIEAPSWLRPLPAFSIDRLEEQFSGGDLFLQISAEESTTVSHAARMLLKDARAFTTLRWQQSGFREPAAPAVPSGSMRNLFGQVDGTSNPRPGTAEFDQTVWIPDGPWAGGTSLVLRRIAMNLDTWDELDAPGRELAVGRRLRDGAPLTGTHELDEPDFAAVSENGFPVIPEFAHLRAARGEEAGGAPMQSIFRRAYNYEDPPREPGQLSDAGLLFASFQADVDTQFVPIQERLDRLDLLNQWTVPVGSAVFAVPPGVRDGEFVGESLLG